MKLLHLIIWAVLYGVCASVGLADPNQAIDQEKAMKVKAAYLYNFTQFITWPPTAHETTRSPFVIGILGDDPFGQVLDTTVKNKTVDGRVLEIRRIAALPTDLSGETLIQLQSCHLLYISESIGDRSHDVVEAVKDHDVLTVSEQASFAESGGMIQFTLESGKIGLLVNRDVAEAEGMKISANLLKLVRIVQSKPRK
jgi:hypothetical protein